MRRTILSVVLLLFGALSSVALWQHGYLGILVPHFRSTAGGQVFADLVIALSLVCVWLVRDARAKGRAAWAWVLFTLVAGSFGPLLYLFTARRTTPETR